MATKTLKYKDLLATLNKRAAEKSATAGSGAPGTPAEQVHETDPQDMGKPAQPHDPNTNPNAQNLPGNGDKSHPNHNSEKTPVLDPAAKPKETVQEGDKAANVSTKAAAALEAIKGFRASLSKSASDKASEAAKPESAADAGKPTEPKEKDAAETANPPGVDDGKAEPKEKNTDKAAEKEDKSKDKSAMCGKCGKDDCKGDCKEAAADKPVEEDKDKKEAQGPKADQVKGDKDPDEKKAPAPREDAVDGVPAKGVNNDKVTGNENKDKAAALEFTPDFHFKLASMILETEEGRRFAEGVIQESMGAEAAQEIVKAAAFMEEQAAQIALAEELGANEAEELWKSASADEQALVVKIAGIHEHAKSKLGEDFLKLAYDMGAGAAADEMDMMGEMPMEGEMPAEGGEELPPEGEASPEDIMAVLQQLVASGQLPPEVADEILAELAGGAAPEGGEEMPPEGAEEIAEKAASVLKKLETSEA